MSACVVPYPADPEDTTNTLMIECRECGIEWGWMKDRPGAKDRLQANADEHNADCHPPVPVPMGMTQIAALTGAVTQTEVRAASPVHDEGEKR